MKIVIIILIVLSVVFMFIVASWLKLNLIVLAVVFMFIVGSWLKLTKQARESSNEEQKLRYKYAEKGGLIAAALHVIFCIFVSLNLPSNNPFVDPILFLVAYGLGIGMFVSVLVGMGIGYIVGKGKE